jgi:hypothetical protein
MAVWSQMPAISIYACSRSETPRAFYQICIVGGRFLPEFLSEVRIKNLCVGGDSIGLEVRRHGEDVSVTVESNKNDIPVLLMK